MTFLEAVLACKNLPITIVCRPLRSGEMMAVRFVPHKPAERAVFSEASRLSHINMYVPRITDVIANDWEIFDPAWFTIPEDPGKHEPSFIGWPTVEAPVEESDPKPSEAIHLRQLMERPVSSPEFRAALSEASDAEIYMTADRLEDYRKTGAKCKTRLEAVGREIMRREKGRGQGGR